MDRTLNRLFRLYPVARNWTILSNYITPLQSMQSMSRTCSLTDYTQLEDVAQPLIKSAKLPYQFMKILDKAAQKSTNMTVREAVSTMSALYDISKYTYKDIHMKHTEKVETHTGFINLCDVLNRNIRDMKRHDIIEILKILSFLNIPSNSVLIQSLLQMIRANINEMSLYEIIFTVFLLKKMDSTPLRDALLIALPLVFETHFFTKLQSDDVTILNWSIRFINEFNIKNQEVYNILFKSLLMHENNIAPKTAWSIFLNLCQVSYLPPIAFDVLANIQQILITNAKEFSITKIIKTLSSLQFVVAMNKTHGYKFYNEALVDALVNSALSSDINFHSGIHLLKLLNNLNYAHIPLLEYLAAKCFEQPDLLKDATYIKLFSFLEGFIYADYKPVFWDTIRDAILANQVENKSTGKSIIRFALYLTALDCYSPSLLSKVFSYNIKNNEEAYTDILAREMLLLYQSIKTLYPMYEGPWPSQDTLEYITNLDPIMPTFSLKAALELALGGPLYIHNNLKTKLGHHIDHVVVMRKGGYPIAINTMAPDKMNINYVEDIQTPSESQTILIFNLPDTAYAVNSQRLKSTWSLRIKSAEVLINSNTVAIHSSSWMKLPEYERVPYLMQAIKLKCEDFSVSVN
ncbi:FAST kinase domain-containing protein 2, mitochondrial-like [Linepithema humile]|uniref:FAST kinase domain-containing protein 2, mitochondrial-like n=1 Tax=Linepithema humile TaxID=83485 RepID=UPI000623976F|nr:PREDICTED: uncharacterized protein LOC105674565 [Linepithema humile]